MTDNQFHAAFTAALSSPDRDAFISSLSSSSLFAGEDETAPVDPALVEELGQVWDVAHLSVADIRAATGLTQRAFTLRHCIPRRTYEDWESGANVCAPYMILLLAQAEGLYTRK